MADGTLRRWVAVVPFMLIGVTCVSAISVSSCRGIERFFPECIYLGRIEGYKEPFKEEEENFWNENNKLVINLVAPLPPPSSSPSPLPHSPLLSSLFSPEDSVLELAKERTIHSKDNNVKTKTHTPVVKKLVKSSRDEKKDKLMAAEANLSIANKINIKKNIKKNIRKPLIMRRHFDFNGDNKMAFLVSASPSPSPSPLFAPRIPPLLLHEMPREETNVVTRTEHNANNDKNVRTHSENGRFDRRTPHRKVDDVRSMNRKVLPRFPKKIEQSDSNGITRNVVRRRVTRDTNEHPVYRLLKELLGLSG